MANNSFKISKSLSLIPQATAPSNPSNGDAYYDSVLNKFRKYENGVWTSFGAGGQGGINLLTLDSSYLITATDNSDAETSIGDWVAYADAAGTSPVDMTGGTPNTTIARDTSSPLNGTAHFTMTVTTGATRQGEGVSCTANVPPAYRGRVVNFTFPFSASGTITDGDFTLFAYDVTNSQIITPYQAGKILGSQGAASGLFSIPTTCTQLRVGIHVARATNTGAVTIKFDDVKVAPDFSAMGMAGSDWTAFTMTIDGSTSAPTKGTISVDNAQWRRDGDSIEILYDYSQTGAGSAGSGTYLFKLPNGLTADTSKVFTTTANTRQTIGSARAYDGGNMSVGEVRLYDSTHVAISTLSDGFNVADIGSGRVSLSGATVQYSFKAVVPIAGWSSNVTMAESSTFRMSSLLANGSRVTTTPTSLGQYRTLTKDASALTFSDNDGSAQVSATNGMRIFATNGTPAGTSGQPNRYVIFVGKNKNVRFDFYSSTGRTGSFSPDFFYYTAGTTEEGLLYTYDPTTGLAIVSESTLISTSSNRVVGQSISSETGAITQLSDGYFDIVVSENALAVGVQAPRSEVFLTGGSGYGSTNTVVQRFTTLVSQTGSGILVSQSSTLGDSFTLLEDGIWYLNYTQGASTNWESGITKNSTQLTTAPEAITNADRLAYVEGVINTVIPAVFEGFLPAGTVIRFTGNGNRTDAARVSARITKVSD